VFRATLGNIFEGQLESYEIVQRVRAKFRTTNHLVQLIVQLGVKSWSESWLSFETSFIAIAARAPGLDSHVSGVQKDDRI